jgi:hypothetical protein
MDKSEPCVSPETAAFMAAITGTTDPAETAAFVAAITVADPFNPRPNATPPGPAENSPGLDEFLAIVRGDSDPAETAAFVAAITDKSHYDHEKSREGNGGGNTGISHADWLNAVRYGFREHNFNPDEPRDEKGRWTADGTDAEPADATTNVVPGTFAGAPMKVIGRAEDERKDREVKAAVDQMVEYGRLAGKVALANADSARKIAESLICWSHKDNEQPLFPPYVLQIAVRGTNDLAEIRNLRDATRLAELQVERTLFVLKNCRDRLKSVFPDRNTALGALARLPDADYQRVVKNFQTAYNAGMNGAITYRVVPTGSEAGTHFASAGSDARENNFYTDMEGIMYGALRPMNVRQSAADEAPARIAGDIAHELGRAFGRQYQNNDNPIWGIEAWDYYQDNLSRWPNFDELTKGRIGVN